MLYVYGTFISLLFLVIKISFTAAILYATAHVHTPFLSPPKKGRGGGQKITKLADTPRDTLKSKEVFLLLVLLCFSYLTAGCSYGIEL